MISRIHWCCLLVKWCRLYTGIHAPKPRPRFKSGAICESTTALNIDQTDASNFNADQKNPAATSLPLPLATAPCPTTKGGNFQEQQTALASSIEIGVGGSTTAEKKEAGLAKAQADKKKIDARKKSLKRL